MYINSAAWANKIGAGNVTSIQMVCEGVVQIGHNCGISNTAITSTSKIIIEENVLLGSGCKMIYDTDFHPLNYDERINDCLSNIII